MKSRRRIGAISAAIMPCLAAALAAPLAFATFPESALGLGYGVYQGPSRSYVDSRQALGVNFAYLWREKHIQWVSSFEVGPLISGQDFGGTGSEFVGIEAIYKFHPKFFIVDRDTFQPYLTAGPALGAFALFLTSLSVSRDISNNQASLKLGFTGGIGGDWRRAKDDTYGGIGLNMEYFYFFPTMAKIEFQAGRIAARGLHLTLRWYLPPPERAIGRK